MLSSISYRLSLLLVPPTNWCCQALIAPKCLHSWPIISYKSKCGRISARWLFYCPLIAVMWDGMNLTIWGLLIFSSSSVVHSHLLSPTLRLHLVPLSQGAEHHPYINPVQVYQNSIFPMSIYTQLTCSPILRLWFKDYCISENVKDLSEPSKWQYASVAFTETRH